MGSSLPAAIVAGMDSKVVESRSVEARAAIFAALSDPLRLRVLDALAAETRCVCELQETVAVAPNLLSYHLKVLRDAGLVEGSRRGRWVDYRLTAAARDMIREALPAGLRP
jgi:ArsR family transcriptional regulator